MSQLPVKIGVEIEFVGPTPDLITHVLRKRYKIPSTTSRSTGYDPSRWTFGHDGSIYESYSDGDDLSEDNAVELRSPILDPCRLKTLERILSVLEPISVVTKSSGMHVHISCPVREAEVDAVLISKALDKKYRKEIWRGRARYCLRGAGLSGEKYRTVNVVRGNHIEVRVFNSSLDFGVVHSRINEVVRLYRSHLHFDGKDGYGRRVCESKKKSVSCKSELKLQEILTPRF